MAPNRIVSLWGMLNISGSAFSGAIVEIASFKLVLENHPHGRAADFSMNGLADVYGSVGFIFELSKNLECAGSALHAEYIINILEPIISRATPSNVPIYKINVHIDLHDIDNLRSFFVSLVTLINAEYANRLFVSIPANHRGFLDDLAIYQDVAEAFPDLLEDLREAGKCRAFGRWTASVMHLMRALEVGLAFLATRVGVAHEESWNTTLNAIEKKLREVSKKIDGCEEEQWAAEAGTHLRFIKNAFRNHAMHPLERYDEDRAVAIFDNTLSFLVYLSERSK